MNHTPTDQKLRDTLDRMTKTRIRVFLFSSGFTLLMIGLFLASGYILDQALGSWPKGFIAAFLLSYPFTQTLLYKKYRAFRSTENISTE